MKFKTKYIYSKEYLKDELKECKRLGLTVLESKKQNSGIHKGSYKITTEEFREI